MLDETTPGVSIINNFNNRLKFLFRKYIFLTPTLRRCLWSAPHFDYATCTWYLSLAKKLKNRIQTAWNKLIRFCLHIENMVNVDGQIYLINKLKLLKLKVNWLPVTKRFNQCINSFIFKYVNGQCTNYLYELSKQLRKR